MLKANDFIKTNNTIQRFVHTQTGEIFTPIGVNYFCKGTGWAPHLWYDHHFAEYDRDFSRMQKLGINIIRVFLSVNTCMSGPFKINEQTMQYIREMLEYAQKYDIRVIFSGVSMWDGRPAWFDDLKITGDSYFSDPVLLEQFAFCWDHVAETCRDYPSLFAYDLQNEPFIPWESSYNPSMWFEFASKRASMPMFADVSKKLFDARNSIPVNSFDTDADVIYAYQAFRNKLSYDFCRICCDAIRKKDTNHMISVGCHQCSATLDFRSPERYAGFDPHVVGKLLDYVSIHYYPYDYDIDIAEDPNNYTEALNVISAHLRYMDVGKPVMMEEFGLYGGGVAPGFGWRPPFKYLPAEMSAKWVNDVVSRNIENCSGFLNWGFDDNKDQGDPTRYQGLFDDDFKIKPLGEIYPDMIKRSTEYVNANPAYVKKTPVEVDLRVILTDQEKYKEFVRFIRKEFHTLDSPFFVVKNAPDFR